jgi:anti-anti-sigma factor
MPTPLELTTDRTEDDVPRVVVTGEMDSSNVHSFATALAATASEHGAVVIDLSAVTYIDSSALNALFTHTGRVARMRVIVPAVLTTVMRISGLGELAEIVPTQGLAT